MKITSHLQRYCTITNTLYTEEEYIDVFLDQLPNVDLLKEQWLKLKPSSYGHRYDEKSKSMLTQSEYNDLYGDDGISGYLNDENWGKLPIAVLKYDSTADTLKHIKRVNELLGESAIELIKRGNVHDNSKLESPEKEIFDVMTPKLKELTYGSDAYKESLKELGVTLTHHYKNNRHHPEYHSKGINDMDLFDILEMLLDWCAASERHSNGAILKSIEINKTRFNMSDQLVDIFINHANRYLIKK